MSSGMKFKGRRREKSLRGNFGYADITASMQGSSKRLVHMPDSARKSESS
jgi:hypothetical protein